MKRRDLDKEYVVPEGWSRVALSEDCDPWLSFIVEVAFDDPDTYNDHEKGLLTFIRKGRGEVWDLAQLAYPNPDYKPPIGWKVIDFNAENNEEMQKRMGYLILDGTFDEDKFEEGVQKLLLKEDTEGKEDMTVKIGCYEEFSYIEKILGDWMQIPEGWEEIELSGRILADLSINKTMSADIQGDRKKLIGKCPTP